MLSPTPVTVAPTQGSATTTRGFLSPVTTTRPRRDTPLVSRHTIVAVAVNYTNGMSCSICSAGIFLFLTTSNTH